MTGRIETGGEMSPEKHFIDKYIGNEVRRNRLQKSLRHGEVASEVANFSITTISNVAGILLSGLMTPEVTREMRPAHNDLLAMTLSARHFDQIEETLLQQNLTVSYLNVVRRIDEDSAVGRVTALLEAGKIIAPYLIKDKETEENITKAWMDYADAGEAGAPLWKKIAEGVLRFQSILDRQGRIPSREIHRDVLRACAPELTVPEITAKINEKYFDQYDTSRRRLPAARVHDAITYLRECGITVPHKHPSSKNASG